MESVQKLETRYPPKLDSFLSENTQKAEEFSIEDLLDFSNDEIFQLHDNEEQQQKEEDTQQHHKIVSSPQNYAAVKENSSVADDFSSISVLEEDLENLKWLSQFVEDSFCEYSLTYPPTKLSEPVQERDILVTSVQTKARSKRTRSGSHAWPAVKKKDDSRRCSHCGVQKTPQWRAGPLGSKTLCNACGVRFKSGRLFPEYRPACSPTFSNELHSNSHRKVLEMRRKKEVEIGPAKPVRRFKTRTGELV